MRQSTLAKRVGGGEQKDERSIPVDGDLIHRVRLLVVDPHAHRRHGGQGSRDRVGGTAVRATREQAGPGSDDTVRYARAMVWVHDGAKSEPCDEGEVVAVAAEQVVEVAEGRGDRGGVTLQVIVEEQQKGLVAGDAVGAPQVVLSRERVAIAVALGLDLQRLRGGRGFAADDVFSGCIAGANGQGVGPAGE